MSDTPETDDFTFGTDRQPINSRGETAYKALQRVERERDEARAKATYYQEQLGHANPEHEWEDLPWEGAGNE